MGYYVNLTLLTLNHFRYISKYTAVPFRRVAVLLNAIAGIERLLTIAFPLKNISRRLCSHVNLIIPGLFVFSLGIHSFFALEYKVRNTHAHTYIHIQTHSQSHMHNFVQTLMMMYNPNVSNSEVRLLAVRTFVGFLYEFPSLIY